MYDNGYTICRCIMFFDGPYGRTKLIEVLSSDQKLKFNFTFSVATFDRLLWKIYSNLLYAVVSVDLV